MAIRVLHVVTQMNRGGLETMIMNYYRNIDRSIIQFDFLTHRPENEKKDYDDEIKALGGKIYHIPRLNPFSIKYQSELDSFFKNHKEYKVIHVHQDCMSSVVLKAARKNGVEIRIAHSHSSNQDKGIKYIIKAIYKKNIKKEATMLFACGQQAGKWMFGTDDFKVLPNAIDAKRYSYDKNKREANRNQLGVGDSFVIGHVGRFSKVKNHKFLIAILSELKKIDDNVKLVLVGEGEERERIQHMVENKGLGNNVIFTGIKSNVNEIMQAFDVFVFPSLYEGLPLTMVEAQAAGLPCFISDRVPSDCKITENVYRISLNENAKKWADKIYSLKDFKRKDTYSEIVNANFDIVQNAKYLQKIYIEQWKKVVDEDG